MPSDADKQRQDAGTADPSQSAPAEKSTSLLQIPAPLKRLFDRFPLVVYPSNTLPHGSFPPAANALYIFTTAADAETGAPSFNPSCLKWQAYLKFKHIPFTTVPSCNHASPSGALPFLIPSRGTSSLPPAAIASAKLEAWIRSAYWRTSTQASSTSSSIRTRENAYNALLTTPIRLAYLHALYMQDDTFTTTTRARYVDPTSSSTAVRWALARGLRALALDELLGGSNGPAERVDVARLYSDARAAFTALDELLGGHGWFADALMGEHAWFADTAQDGEDGEAQPGMLDAAVFAYTHVVLRLLGSGDRLYDIVAGCKRLVRHQERVLEKYFRM